MRGKVAKKIRKTIYGDYSHNLRYDDSINPVIRKKNRDMGWRMRRQYQQAKKEHNYHGTAH